MLEVFKYTVVQFLIHYIDESWVICKSHVEHIIEYVFFFNIMLSYDLGMFVFSDNMVSRTKKRCTIE